MPKCDTFSESYNNTDEKYERSKFVPRRVVEKNEFEIFTPNFAFSPQISHFQFYTLCPSVIHFRKAIIIPMKNMKESNSYLDALSRKMSLKFSPQISHFHPKFRIFNFTRYAQV